MECALSLGHALVEGKVTGMEKDKFWTMVEMFAWMKAQPRK